MINTKSGVYGCKWLKKCLADSKTDFSYTIKKTR